MRRVVRRRLRFSRSFIGTAVAAFIAATFFATFLFAFEAQSTDAATLLPTAPLGVTVSPAAAGRMTLAWRAPLSSAVSSTGTSVAVTSYEYREAFTLNSGSTWSGYAPAVTLLATSGRQAVPCSAPLAAGGGCRYVLAARSAAGLGAWTSPATALWAPPSAPRTPIVVGRHGAHVASVAWKTPTVSGGLPLKDTLAQVSTDGGVTWSAKIESLAPAYTTSAFVLPATCETNSECRVRLYALNAAGRSAPTLAAQIQWRSVSSEIGIATGTPYVPDGMTEPQFWNRVAATGAGWARIDCAPLSYASYSTCDDRVAEARRVGLHLVLTLAYRPPNSPDIFTNSEHQQWAIWAGEVAARLTSANPGTIGAFEIWNEPNNPAFWSPVDPVAYADLLARTAFAIRMRSSVPILTGGLSPGGVNGGSDATTDPRNPATWLAGIYSAGSRGHFDAVGHHPYDTYSSVTNQGPPRVGWESGYRAAHWLRVVLDANGDSAKRIWATEAGTPSCTGYSGGKFSEGLRATRLRDDIADWTRGIHNPWTGESIGLADKSDWNTGPFMVFKMYKQYDAPGLGLSFATAQCGHPAWYEPAPVDMLKTLTTR